MQKSHMSKEWEKNQFDDGLWEISTYCKKFLVRALYVQEQAGAVLPTVAFVVFEGCKLLYLMQGLDFQFSEEDGMIYRHAGSDSERKLVDIWVSGAVRLFARCGLPADVLYAYFVNLGVGKRVKASVKTYSHPVLKGQIVTLKSDVTNLLDTLVYAPYAGGMLAAHVYFSTGGPNKIKLFFIHSKSAQAFVAAWKLYLSISEKYQQYVVASKDQHNSLPADGTVVAIAPRAGAEIDVAFRIVNAVFYLLGRMVGSDPVKFSRMFAGQFASPAVVLRHTCASIEARVQKFYEQREDERQRQSQDLVRGMVKAFFTQVNKPRSLPSISGSPGK